MSHRILTTSFASVYPHYVAKAEKNGRTQAEVDHVIFWLTGYGRSQFDGLLADKTTSRPFSPKLHGCIPPARISPVSSAAIA